MLLLGADRLPDRAGLRQRVGVAGQPAAALVPRIPRSGPRARHGGRRVDDRARRGRGSDGQGGRVRVRGAALGLAVALTVSGAAYAAGSSSAGDDADQRPVEGTHCPTFPADNYWHADIRHLPVHPRSRQWLSHMSTSVDLHPDFGPSFGDGPNYGIPVTVVGGAHRAGEGALPVRERERPRALPAGQRHPDRGRPEVRRRPARDRRRPRHLPALRDLRDPAAKRSLVRRLGCDLVAHLRPAPAERVDLRRRRRACRSCPGCCGGTRSRTATSTTRSGSPPTSPRRTTSGRPGTTPVRARSHAYPPMGARFRLRASYHPSGFGPRAMAVVRAMKTYGLVLADNGSPWFFQGEQNATLADLADRGPQADPGQQVRRRRHLVAEGLEPAAARRGSPPRRRCRRPEPTAPTPGGVWVSPRGRRPG